MSNANINENKLFIKDIIEQDIKFVIPTFQRGYRWTDDNVKDLIKDIFEEKDNEYSLQLLVNKADDEKTKDVIDD